MSKKTKSITLKVPYDFIIPEFYETASPLEAAEAVTIGQALFNTVKAASTNHEIQKIEEEKERQITKLKEDAAETIKAHEVQILKIETDLRERKREHSQQLQAIVEQEEQAKKAERELLTQQSNNRMQVLEQNFNQQIQTLKQQEQAKQVAEKDKTDQSIRALEKSIEQLKAANQTLQDRKLDLETNRDRDIQAATLQANVAVEKLLAEKDKALQQAREDLKATNHRNEQQFAMFNELIRLQTEEIRNLKDGINKKSTNVKTKGNDFEEILRIKLINSYGSVPNFSLKNTGKSNQGHAGDLILRWLDHLILWEFKDYSHPVPEDEVKKFKRDMIENSEVTIGIMISRYTGITGKVSQGDFHSEFMEGKMLIYISDFNRLSDEILPMLKVLFQVYWHSGNKLEEDEGKVNAIRQIEKLYKSIDERKKEWRNHKAHQENAIRFTAELVEDMETSLKRLLNDLQGTVERIQDIPENIFREHIGDEKAKEKIQYILACTEYDPKGTTELNKLADEYAKRRGAMSRDTAKTHIKSVLLDKVIQQNKGTQPQRVIGLVLRSEDLV
jgi:hypothetical protein